MDPALLIASIIGALICIFVTFIYYSTNKNKENLKRKLNEYKKRHTDAKVFLCKGDEKLDTNSIQIYGYPVNITIRPGMRICDHRGILFVIKEVYTDDTTPEKLNKEINETSGNSALVIEINNWDSKSFNEKLKKEKLLALRVE